MFYYLYLKFHGDIHLFNLFRYITFRTAYASLTALVLSLVLGPWVIEQLKKFQVGQFIREEGPQSHQSKAGTPTVGGMLINLCIVIPTLLWADLTNLFVWLVLGVSLAFAAIGFWDDYQKVRRRQNLGMTGRTKILLQVLTSFLFGVVLMGLTTFGKYSTDLTFPFYKQIHPDFLIARFLSNPWTYVLAYLPFLLFVILVLV
ncbi:MAG: phospho-N-acetylmuramoyl-pentapeptide-transferase, partial [Acidobacteria bacterium]